MQQKTCAKSELEIKLVEIAKNQQLGGLAAAIVVSRCG
jgi:hypothetical protein